MSDWNVIHGDCIAVMAAMEPDSIDAIVTDPPYGLEFMGKDWDSFKADSHIGKGWSGGFGNVDLADGAERQKAPNYSSAANVRCLNCNKWKLSSNPCICADPVFPDIKAASNRAFQAWCTTWATEALRVLKPGGFLLAFGGSRTSHRMVSAIEDAGFEIRDQMAWIYGSGFPKSLDIGKAIDKRKDWSALSSVQTEIKKARTKLGISQSEAARRAGIIGLTERLPGGGFIWFETGFRLPTRDQYFQIKQALEMSDDCDLVFEQAEREIVGERLTGIGTGKGSVPVMGDRNRDITEPATDLARKWDGWGTALKPAIEPICVARKPFPGSVAANVAKWGTGGLNIDASRIMAQGRPLRVSLSNDATNVYGDGFHGSKAIGQTELGRWPANVILDEAAAEALDAQSGVTTSRKGAPRASSAPGDGWGMTATGAEYDAIGGASRFFFVAKASAADRSGRLKKLTPDNANNHPTVKPTELLIHLVRLVTPPGGTVLDPFAGSGSTLIAATRLGFRAIGIEQSAEYVALCRDRIRADAPLLNMEGNDE